MENKVISSTVTIGAGVELGAGSVVEDFCIIGVGLKKSGDEKTIIGEGAVIRSHTVIYPGNKIGKGFATGNKANIREKNQIGDNVSIGTLSVIEHHVLIGNNVRVHSQVFIPEYSVIENDAWIGPNAVFTNAKYPNTSETKNNLIGPIVRKGARIGANATLLPGVEIGQYSIVGAGSVVTKDVESYSIVAGNPAKIIGKVEI